MAIQYNCQKPRRRAQVLAAHDGGGNPVLNGIDFLEVVSADEKTLAVHFLFDLPGSASPVPPLPAPPLTAANVVIRGGVRITGITIASVSAAANILTVTVAEAGDYSTYTLTLITSNNNPAPPTGFDPQLSSVEFSFKIECPSDFDCKPDDTCPPPVIDDPDIDYLAKDYASFRRLILDRMARTMPEWVERNPSDIGIALAEILAYAGDQLSYYQDAVATEAYLGTARQRISVRRHARLLDYFMHDGCNARAWVFFNVDVGPAVVVPKGTRLLTQTLAARGVIAEDQAAKALTAGAQAFETLFAFTAQAELDRITFYTWSDQDCCLPRGATGATLTDNGSGPFLRVGDLLLFEEVLGPATGFSADANPAHRHVVRLTQVALTHDPIDNTAVVEIAWDSADALPFPLCLSTVIGNISVADVSIARGNIALADHGVTQPAEDLPIVDTTHGPYRPQLQNPDITCSVAYDDKKARLQPAAGLLLQDARQALPVIVLRENGSTWLARRDLLSSSHNALDFVVEIQNDGTVTLRFGDGTLGSQPVSHLKAIYRTSNGTQGNVGAEAIANAVATATVPLAGITDVRNPLAAQGGVDPETLDQVRSFAPWAFRTQERAVTEADYAEVSQRQPEVAKAEATLRWTGSWYTMFITVDRKGGQPVDSAFRARMRDFLETFRLAGYDLEIEAPLFVPLDLAFTVCVEPGYFRSDVRKELLAIFSNRDLPDGRRGFFHPDNFTFGQPVYLSQIVAEVMRVPGVRWIDTNDILPAVNHFKRLGQAPHGETAAGRITMARLEIARLDNDPSDPENGKIDFFVEGGL
jgi:hypothetical protein